MIGTQTGASCRLGVGICGDVWVSVRLDRKGGLAAAALAVALAGCGNLGLDSDQPWFRKQFDLAGKAGGYTFSDTQQVRQDRPITAGDLIAANGSCPPPAAAAPAPNPAAAPIAAPDNASLLGEG